MSSSGMIGKTTPLPSFDAIVDKFRNAKADQHIRFGEGKQFYTSQKASLTGIKAVFGNAAALQARDTKRQEGASKILAVLEQDYGKGIAGLVLKNVFKGATPTGITKADLGAMQAEVGKQLETAEALKAFVGDNLGALLGSAKPSAAADLEAIAARFSAAAEAKQGRPVDADMLKQKANDLRYVLLASAHDHFEAKGDQASANAAVRGVIDAYIDGLNQSSGILGIFMRDANPATSTFKDLLAKSIAPTATAFVNLAIERNAETPFSIDVNKLDALSANPAAYATNTANAIATLDTLMSATVGRSPLEAKEKVAAMDPKVVTVLREAASQALQRGASNPDLGGDPKELAYKVMQDFLFLRTLNPALVTAKGEGPEGPMKPGALRETAKLTQTVFNLAKSNAFDVPEIQEAQSGWQKHVIDFYDAILASG